MDSPAAQKHMARLQRAKELRAKKSRVPHATGQRWTGKRTTPRAPRLSYQTRPRRNHAAAPQEKPTGYAGASERRFPKKHLRGSSTNTTERTPDARKSTVLTPQKSGANLSSVPRGSFSSPYHRAQTSSHSTAASSQDTTLPPSLEELAEQPTEITRTDPMTTKSNHESESLIHELERLRRELRAEEEKHKLLLESKEQLVY